MEKEYLILEGDYMWKREYLRVIKFKSWNRIEDRRVVYLDPKYKKLQKPKELIKLKNFEILCYF